MGILSNAGRRSAHRNHDEEKVSPFAPVLRALALWSFDRARLVLVLMLLFLIASVPLICRLRVDTDFAKLLARDGEALLEFGRPGSGPGGRNPLLVTITAGESSDADLELVSERFLELAGALDGVSLFAAGAGGGGDPLLDGAMLKAALLNQDPPRYEQLLARMAPPEMERQIRRARRRLAMADDPALRQALATDLLGVFELTRPFLEVRLSERGKALLGGSPPSSGSVFFWLSPNGRADDSQYCIDLMAELDEIALRAVEGSNFAGDATFSFSGLHAMTAESTIMLRNDLLVITVWASGLLLALLTMVLRRLSLVVLCFVPLAVSVILLLDVAVLLFNPIYFVTIGFVAIVLGLGLDVAVHLTGRFSAKLETLPRREAIEATVQEVGRPLAAGVLSTAAAFLALLITGRPALVEFGLLTAVGLLLTLAATMVVFPALVRVLVAVGPRRTERRLRILTGSFDFFDRNRRWCFAAGLVLVALSLPWAARFRWHMDPMDFFAGNTASVETTATMEASSGVALTSAFQIHIEAPGMGSALGALRVIDDVLEEAVREGEVFGFESPSMLLPYDDGGQRMESTERLDRAHFFDLLDRFGIKRTDEHDRYLETLEQATTLPTGPAEILALLPEACGNLVSTSSDRVALRITVWPASTETGGELFSDTPAEEAVSMLAKLELPDDVRVGVLGMAHVLNGIQQTAGSSFRSVGALALVLVLAVLWIFFRGVASIALSLIPIAGALPAMLAGVVLLGIPVTPTAIAFGAIILGVGIDDAVHMVFLSGPPFNRRISTVLAEVGPVVTLTTVSTAIGFGSLMWSSHPVVSSLGSAVVLGVGAAWLFTMLLAPTLLRHRRRRRLSAAGAILLIVAVFPQRAWAQSDDAAELLSRLHERAASTETVSCEFRQVKVVSQLEGAVETEGSMLFSHPDRFRVEVHGELNLLLLGDGRALTMVDLDFDEVERISIDEIGQRPAMLGPFAMLFELRPEDVGKRFVVERRDGNDGLSVLVFHPKRISSETREIRLWVDKRLRTRRLEWFFENGDSIVTEFSKWRRRSSPPDEVFEFNGEAQWGTVE